MGSNKKRDIFRMRVSGLDKDDEKVSFTINKDVGPVMYITAIDHLIGKFSEISGIDRNEILDDLKSK